MNKQNIYSNREKDVFNMISTQGKHAFTNIKLVIDESKNFNNEPINFGNFLMSVKDLMKEYGIISLNGGAIVYDDVLDKVGMDGVRIVVPLKGELLKPPQTSYTKFQSQSN